MKQESGEKVDSKIIRENMMNIQIVTNEMKNKTKQTQSATRFN